MRKYKCKYNKSAQKLRLEAADKAFIDLDPNDAFQLEDAMHRLGSKLGLSSRSTFELLTCLGIFLAENEPAAQGKSSRISQPKNPLPPRSLAANRRSRVGGIDGRSLQHEFFPG